jgi:hypothetical protein
VAPNSASMTYMGRPNDMFGIIVSIKEAFGVIQLLRTEEQIIFSVRDGNRDVAIGSWASVLETLNLLLFTPNQTYHEATDHRYLQYLH